LRAKIETMDFFAAQEKALQRTKRLVAMFGLAVAGTVLACYAVVAWALVARASGRLVDWWEPVLFLKVAGGVLLVVGAAAGYKWKQYSAGGAAVAQSAGGRRVEPETHKTRGAAPAQCSGGDGDRFRFAGAGGFRPRRRERNKRVRGGVDPR
jgi:hypothetical protein